MNVNETALQRLGRLLEKIGFLPPDDDDGYAAARYNLEQFGDARDCDDANERKIFDEKFRN